MVPLVDRSMTPRALVGWMALKYAADRWVVWAGGRGLGITRQSDTHSMSADYQQPQADRCSYVHALIGHSLKPRFAHQRSWSLGQKGIAGYLNIHARSRGSCHFPALVGMDWLIINTFTRYGFGARRT